MLLHLSSRRSFWLCSHCRVEVPHTDAQTQCNKNTSLKFTPAKLKVAIAPLHSEQKVATI
ncbi:MAG: hypothetical protein AAFQ41_06780 [Cyanobacteria bacterium J06623_7]